MANIANGKFQKPSKFTHFASGSGSSLSSGSSSSSNPSSAGTSSSNSASAGTSSSNSASAGTSSSASGSSSSASGSGSGSGSDSGAATVACIQAADQACKAALITNIQNLPFDQQDIEKNKVIGQIQDFNKQLATIGTDGSKIHSINDIQNILQPNIGDGKSPSQKYWTCERDTAFKACVTKGSSSGSSSSGSSSSGSSSSGSSSSGSSSSGSSSSGSSSSSSSKKPS